MSATNLEKRKNRVDLDVYMAQSLFIKKNLYTLKRAFFLNIKDLQKIQIAFAYWEA